MSGRKVEVKWKYHEEKRQKKEQKLLPTAWSSLLAWAYGGPGSILFLGWNPVPLVLPFSHALRELFSSNSANSLYDKAVADCLAHEKLADLLGEPIKAFGEPTV